jgi:hypothetical protein
MVCKLFKVFFADPVRRNNAFIKRITDLSDWLSRKAKAIVSNAIRGSTVGVGAKEAS